VCDEAHGEIDAELSRSPQNLVRTQGVELVESVKDHDVGEHVLSVEEGIVNNEYVVTRK